MSPDPSPPDRKPTIFGRPAAAAFLAILAFAILAGNYLAGNFDRDARPTIAEAVSASEEPKAGGAVTVEIESGRADRTREIPARPNLDAAVENLEVSTREFAADQRKRRLIERFRPLPGGVEMAQLERIASCESGGDPRIISSNGLYHGKYQFLPDTWASVGGKGLPSDAPEVEQDYRAALLLERSGPGQWPVCGS